MQKGFSTPDATQESSWTPDAYKKAENPRTRYYVVDAGRQENSVLDARRLNKNLNSAGRQPFNPPPPKKSTLKLRDLSSFSSVINSEKAL